MITYIAIEILGWIGVVAILIAYAAVSAKRWNGDSIIYQMLNLIGSMLVIVNSFYNHAYPSVAINVAWILIATYALILRKHG